jgi:hypothetical protein
MSGIEYVLLVVSAIITVVLISIRKWKKINDR